MAKYAVPEYISNRYKLINECPSGHRFLLYFKGWDVGNDEKQEVLSNISKQSKHEITICKEIVKRQLSLAEPKGAYLISGIITSPLVTGMGNPHPAENGFSFLSPYGVSYLPGSSIKGVIRRAAEELALMDDNSPWTIPMVWVLFGFEAGSAYLTGECENHAEGWPDMFAKWVQDNADSDALLRAWLDMVCPDRSRKPDEPERSPSEILASWMGESGKIARKDIHWKGLLRFWDAFPTGDVKLGVDIMNPHHMKYLRGENPPHDSEQPTPIFFLVLEPGAEFRFHVEAVEHRGLLERTGDWRALLEEAFRYAFDFLGFGAKTSVGYGAMKSHGSSTISKKAVDDKTISMDKTDSKDTTKKEDNANSVIKRAVHIKNQETFVDFLKGINENEIEELRDISFKGKESVINIGLVESLEAAEAIDEVKKIIASKMLEVIKPKKKWDEEKKSKYRKLLQIAGLEKE